MEKLKYDETTYIYKTKLDLSDYKSEMLSKCEDVIKNLPGNRTDGFGYFMEKNNIDFLGNIKINNILDKIIQFSINSCIELYEQRKLPYNLIETDSWINVVRSKNPVQPNFYNGANKYHKHTDINKTMESFVPVFTYVYYIQMPNNLQNEDGVLYFLGENNKEYYILPEEGDLIIMNGDLPHSPNNAENSTLDRMVLAGNIGFSYIKKGKSLI
jgi:hypothetical protein